MITPLPNCLGCIYLDQDGTCGHWHKAKATKAKLGVKTGLSGGCALFRGNRRMRGGRSVLDYDDRVRELYDKGLDDLAISVALGHSRNAVFGWRHRHGLPPNGKPGPKKKNLS